MMFLQNLLLWIIMVITTSYLGDCGKLRVILESIHDSQIDYSYIVFLSLKYLLGFCLDKCCTQLTIASTGLVFYHHPEVLGNYTRDGVSNFKIAYKKDGSDHYLYSTPEGDWMVS